MAREIAHVVDPDGTLRVRVANHVPYNRFSWQSNGAVAELRVKDYNGHVPSNPHPWTSITITEHQPDKNGRIRSKTIDITLDPETRAALIALLAKEV